MFPFFSYFSLLCLFTLSLSHFSLPARLFPDSITVIPPLDTHNATWHNFTRFLNAGIGSQVTGISELKRYFHHFGYLTVPENSETFTDFFDTQFESAIIAYQTNLALPVTGKLDTKTITAITTPRCGINDTKRGSTSTPRGVHTTGHFAYFEGRPRWVRNQPVTLTYSFSKQDLIDYIDFNDIRTVFKRAFSRWSAVIPLTFTEVDDSQKADITIGWFKEDHGDGEPFDGVLGILGHAFSPENGRLHLDGAETWAVDFGNQKSKVAVDLESVATHEIGHVLGLAHSSIKESIMYPSLSPRTKKVDLRVDDVKGVQALYGSNPNFEMSSLLESENSSNLGVGIRSCRSSSWTWSFLVGGVLMLI